MIVSASYLWYLRLASPAPHKHSWAIFMIANRVWGSLSSCREARSKQLPLRERMRTPMKTHSSYAYMLASLAFVAGKRTVDYVLLHTG